MGYYQEQIILECYLKQFEVGVSKHLFAKWERVGGREQVLLSALEFTNQYILTLRFAVPRGGKVAAGAIAVMDEFLNGPVRRFSFKKIREFGRLGRFTPEFRENGTVLKLQRQWILEKVLNPVVLQHYMIHSRVNHGFLELPSSLDDLVVHYKRYEPSPGRDYGIISIMREEKDRFVLNCMAEYTLDPLDGGELVVEVLARVIDNIRANDERLHARMATINAIQHPLVETCSEPQFDILFEIGSEVERIDTPRLDIQGRQGEELNEKLTAKFRQRIEMVATVAG